MPGKENMRSSRSSALGMFCIGMLDENAGLLFECAKSCINAFLRSRFACWADLPAVGKGRGSPEHGQGSALSIAILMSSSTGVKGPSSGLFSISDSFTSGGGGAE